MLTLITGTPGAGKTLYAVSEECASVPGTTIEVKGEPTPRRLVSNIKGLLVEHQHIDADDLNTWHTWAKPGDVIVFDEVQEAWRPRGLGGKVPECIQALETHRHMGVDIVLVTQHPMLVDQNIRRLVNRHVHVRRINALPFAVRYEWDHCADPARTKQAIGMKPWRYPKNAMSLYKSATAHTKPKMRLSGPVLVLVVALGGLGWFGPGFYAKLQDRYAGKKAEPVVVSSVTVEGPKKPASAPQVPSPTLPQALTAIAPLAASSAPGKVAGCIASATKCVCYGGDGMRVEAEPAMCTTHTGGDRPAKVALDVPESLEGQQGRWKPSAADTEVMAWMAQERAAEFRRARGGDPVTVVHFNGRLTWR